MSFLAAFGIWTILVCWVDVQAIGPCETTVGFSKLNAWFHELTGVNMTLYTITDWMGIFPILIVIGFATLGLVQWIGRKSIKRVDIDLLVLGGFYLVVLFVFLFFEIVVINYRPILIDDVLEASYPSSTTMLALCVMPSAAMQMQHRIKHPLIRALIIAFFLAFGAIMLIGRLIAGVHWLSDIIGGVLFSTGMVIMYSFFEDWAK